MAKFYFTSLARRPLTLSGRVFKFSVFSLSGGSASGVYEATDPEEIRILDEAVAGRRGVRAMSEEEGANAKKKATPTLRFANSTVSKARIIQPPILPQLSVEQKAGVPYAGKPQGTNPEENMLSSPSANRPSIGNLLRLGKVNPPKPFATAEDKTKKSAARAERAKIRVIRDKEGSRS